ncbi:MAG: protein-glutamate O-methyltransferase [Thermodesulfobacteriota bacterium]
MEAEQAQEGGATRPGARPGGSEGWSRAALRGSEFRRLAEFVQGHCGIRMPEAKRVMVESRLRKRLRVLGLPSFRAYCDYVFGSRGEGERVHLVDALTTNKTDFFREPQHFEYLVRAALPQLVREAGSGVRRPLAAWSAACSTGEEPYTLAMVLSEVAEGLPGFRFQVLATDISTRVLERARNAVYAEERVEPVPAPLRRKYLLRSRDRTQGLVRVAPELRSTVRFRHLNLLDADFGLREPQDVIFCRNVMIYFDRETQEGVLNRLCRHLAPGGYVFLGHSETINGLRVPLRPVAPTIYRLTGEAP